MVGRRKNETKRENVEIFYPLSSDITIKNPVSLLIVTGRDNQYNLNDKLNLVILYLKERLMV